LSIIIGVLLLRNYLYYFNDRPTVYYSTFCRIDSLVIGALTWFYVQKPLLEKRVMWVGITALLVLIAGYTGINGMWSISPFSITAGYTVFAFLFASILYMVVIKPGSIGSQILKNSFLRYTGKISYGMYIFHFPVMIIARAKISPVLQVWHLPVGLTLDVIALSITYTVSTGSYYFYERYFLTQKK
jgi:peptidoglycan/LPS O-acetylase OafA/YrhL